MRRGRLAILLGTAALYGAAMLVPRGHAHTGTAVDGERACGYPSYILGERRAIAAPPPRAMVRPLA